MTMSTISEKTEQRVSNISLFFRISFIDDDEFGKIINLDPDTMAVIISFIIMYFGRVNTILMIGSGQKLPLPL